MGVVLPSNFCSGIKPLTLVALIGHGVGVPVFVGVGVGVKVAVAVAVGVAVARVGARADGYELGSGR